MILYYFQCNLIVQQSLAWLRTAFGDEAPCKTTIYNWFAEFKSDRVDLSNRFPDDRLYIAVNNKNIGAARRVIETDRLVTYHEIRASLGIYLITLTEAQKTNRVTWCDAILTSLVADLDVNPDYDRGTVINFDFGVDSEPSILDSKHGRTLEFDSYPGTELTSLLIIAVNNNQLTVQSTKFCRCEISHESVTMA
ncbi:hypothetical protein EVAR_75354_1 [Eumeta japonica]|uniref:Mos1 transposase HTH domain-containing protein n=1 Tax=Eumeta variegata TaxID=151549 RepID=A0A4C1YEH8_EUMVA|nr:hypothetical protein EVAR_75354_1 [Eumeta japonica]